MRGRGACVTGGTTIAAGDTHPTGMHSCLSYVDRRQIPKGSFKWYNSNQNRR